jgi:hypothetical protein
VVYRAYSVGQVTLPDGSVSYNKLANNIRLFTVDNYIANSSISTYALSEAPADANTLAVSIDGIVQRAPINYTTTANTITFTSAPPTGANVHIKHLGFRSSSVVTAIPAGTTIAQPVLSNPTITLAAEGSSFKGNVALFNAAGSSQVGRFGATSTGQVQLDAGANTVSVRASTIAFANVTSFSTANVSGATGISVDAASRITTPSQPYFYARNNVGGDGITANPATFNTIDVNVGGHFNGTRFTAPVSGMYLFACNPGYKQTSVDMAFRVSVNGSDWVDGVRIIGSGLSSHSGVSFVFMRYLSVNDYVQISAMYTPYHTNTTLNYFSGVLLG